MEEGFKNVKMYIWMFVVSLYNFSSGVKTCVIAMESFFPFTTHVNSPYKLEPFKIFKNKTRMIDIFNMIYNVIHLKSA